MKSKPFCYYNHKRNQFLDFLLTGNGIKALLLLQPQKKSIPGFYSHMKWNQSLSVLAQEMESKPTCSCNRI